MRAGLLLLFAVGCTRPPVEERTHIPPDIQMREVTVRQYRGSATEVLITAPSLEAMRHTGDFSLADASVTLKAQGLEVEAARVEGNLHSGVLEGTGGVVVHREDGLVVKTATASYDRAAGSSGQGAAWSDAGVLAEHPRFTLEGEGFTVDLGTGTAVFDHPVTRTRP